MAALNPPGKIEHGLSISAWVIRQFSDGRREGAAGG
jgi:hypothetical protein